MQTLKKKSGEDWLGTIVKENSEQAAKELKRQEQKKMLELLKKEQRGRR